MKIHGKTNKRWGGVSGRCSDYEGHKEVERPSRRLRCAHYGVIQRELDSRSPHQRPVAA